MEAFSQSLENGWDGIKPLVTTKTAAEKILGKPTSVDNDVFYWYEKVDAELRINYSSEPCSKVQFGRGDFSVPKQTVLNYEVHIRNAAEWPSFNVNPANFVRDTSGDVLNSVNYYSRDFNITISGKTSPADGKDHLATIRFGPAKAEAEKFHCKTN